MEIYYNGIGYVGSGQQDVAEALEAPEPQGTEKPRQASCLRCLPGYLRNHLLPL